MVVEGVLAGIVQLQRAVERVAQEGFPEAVHGARVCGRLAEEQPAFAQVVGVADGDAEVGVATVAGVFGVVPEGDDESAGGKLEDVGVVDVVGVGGTSGYVALGFPVFGGQRRGRTMCCEGFRTMFCPCRY